MTRFEVDLRGRVCLVDDRVRRRDPWPAAVRHGIAGVDGEIEQHLLDLVRVDADLAERRVDGRLQEDVLTEDALQHPLDVSDHPAERDDTRLEHLLPAERE